MKKGKRTITTGVLSHVEFFEKTLHQWARNRCAGDNTRAEVARVKVGWLGETQDRFEHCGNTVQCGAFLVGYGVKNGLGVECLAGEDDLRAVSDYREHTQNQTEAVEEGRRAAQNVEGGKVHAVANKSGVVNQVARQVSSYATESSKMGILMG